MTSELTEVLLILIEIKDPNRRTSWLKVAFTQTIDFLLIYLSCGFV